MKNENKKIAAFRFLFVFFLVSTIFISALFASSNSHSIANNKDIMKIFLNYWAPWTGAIFYAMTIGLIIYVCSWFYASAVSDEKLKAWVKRELTQLVFSAVIFMAVLPIIVSIANICVMLPAYTPWSGTADGAAWAEFVEARCNMVVTGMERPCHIRIAEDYLQILAKSSQAQIQSVLRINSVIAVLSTFSIEFKGMVDPAGQLTVSPLVGLAVVSDTLQFVMDLQMKNFLTIRAQQYLIDFIHLGFFPMFLVIGIFLRIFYFSRKLGGLFIAIAISLYLVYPLMYVFFHAVLFQIAGPWSGNFSDISETDRIGTDMFRVDLSFEGMNAQTIAPVKSSTAYNEPVTHPDVPAGNVKGDYCANGILDPWEECNEPLDAINGSDPKNINPDIKIGFVDLSCKAGEYCNTDSCSCEKGLYAGRTGDFRKDYLGGKMRNASIDEQSILISKICFEPYNETLTQIKKNENKQFISSAKKHWYEKWLESWGGAFYAALAQEEMLGENGIIDNLAKLLLFSLLCPFVSLMVTLSSIKVMSPLLGGDVEIAGLTRLI